MCIYQINSIAELPENTRNEVYGFELLKTPLISGQSSGRILINIDPAATAGPPRY